MADKVLKQIPEQKLKAFSIGTMGKRQLSKREIEEQKKKEQEKAAAQAFEEFVATFQEVPNKTGKVWVKAGTYDAGKRQEDTKEKGKLYKPTSRIDVEKNTSTDKAQEYAKLLGERSRPEKPGKKKEKDKKKSNLELFKEELRQIQEEREERHKYKGIIKNSVIDQEVIKIVGPTAVTTQPTTPSDDKSGSYDSGDPNTTNIYLGNISPKITEQQLMELFGKYGPLASIKIMWPRSDEEKSRGRNCGFVAFMNRKDGERAMKALGGKEIMGYEMKLGWGKAVPIPVNHPIYIPPALLKLTLPPAPTGLPFNALPHPKDKYKIPRMKQGEPYPVHEDDRPLLNQILPQALVKVVIPTDRNLVLLIHHMIEYVIREGPVFEAMIMNRELNNPLFRFLFDNQSPAHLYYRWKLFSMLQGDSQREWSAKEFRMFKGGSIWRPPPMNMYSQGMPEELIEKDDLDRKGGLSPTQRDRLEQLIRNMNPERMKVAEVMVFCIEHAEAADEICDTIMDSLSNPDTVIYKRVARLYLVSDILHNCGIKMTNASAYRRCLEGRLPEIFRQARLTYISLEGRLKAEALKQRVMNIFQAWDDWAIYPRDLLKKLKCIFIGKLYEEEEHPIEQEEPPPTNEPTSDIDGEDLDGVPLDGAALLKSASDTKMFDEDIDGVPLMDDDIDGKPMSPEDKKPSGAFIPSKWETVDPELIEAQAMTTSKWELIEQHGKDYDEKDDIDKEDGDNSLDSNRGGDEEARRQKLREVEVKVMQYQDELESGKRSLKSGFSIQEQVEHHRKKLIRKIEKGKSIDRKRESNSPTDSDKYRKGKRSRSRSASPRKFYRSRSRSRSPYNRNKSRRSPPSRRAERSPSPELARSSKSSSRRAPSPVSSNRSNRRQRGSSSESSPYLSSNRRRSVSPQRNRGRKRSATPHSPYGPTSTSRRRTPSPPVYRAVSNSSSSSRTHTSKRHKHKHRH